MDARGLTLLELLITLSIIGILLCLAMPMNSLLDRQRIFGNATQLASSLRHARTHAVLKQTGVTIQALEHDWASGWQIFTDPNRNAQLDPGETLIHVRAIANGTLARGNRPVADYVHFTMTGEPELISGAFQAGTLVFCSPRYPELRYQLILGKAGRVRLEQLQGSQACP